MHTALHASPLPTHHTESAGLHNTAPTPYPPLEDECSLQLTIFKLSNGLTESVRWPVPRSLILPTTYRASPQVNFTFLTDSSHILTNFMAPPLISS